MMEDEVVRRRGWMSRERFLDYLGATNLIPGPNSTELAIHIGHARAGWPGLLLAGAAFILPATLIVLAAAYAYVEYGTLPQVRGLLYGVQPVVIAIVGQALWGLGRTAVKSVGLGVLGALALAAVAAGTHELIVLTGAAVTMAVVRVVRNPRGAMALLAAACWHSGSAAAGAFAASQAVQTPFSLWTLFLVFAKAGAVLFGSGYVLLAFLRADLVERMGLLTERQLLDAIAIGQVTPGPVFTTATFIGYLLAGVPGAAIATVGIFLPAFFFVAISGPFVPRLRRSATAGAVLDGVNVASLALMAVVTWQLAASALIDPLTLALCGGSLAALVFFRVNSTWLITTGAAVGLALGNVA